MENYTKIIKYKTKEYTMNFIVTAGSPQYKEDYSNTFRSIDFFLIFYDVTSTKTFDDSKLIAQEVKEHLSKQKESLSKIFIAGNKSEMKTKTVKPEEGEDYCQLNGFNFHEISVKSNSGIKRLVNMIIDLFEEYEGALKK